MYEENDDLLEIRNNLRVMKDMASWDGRIRNLRVFPAPDGEVYKAKANATLTIIDKMHTICAPSNDGLDEIHQLEMQTRHFLREGDEDSCYPLWKQMTHVMNQFNNRIEDWLDRQRVI